MRDARNGEWLRELEVFGDCDDACTARLLGQLRLERYQEGDVIACGHAADDQKTVRIIKEGCVEVRQKVSGSKHETTEVLADGEYFGALPALGVACRMGSMLVRAMGQVECFALTDETVRNVLGCGPRPATSSRAATAERSARGGTADPFHATWGGGRSGKVQPLLSGSGPSLPATGPKTTPRLPSRGQKQRGVVPEHALDDQPSLKNFLGGDWVSVQVQKVHADAWIDAGRSGDDSMAMMPNASVTPTRGSSPNRSTTPCKPTTPCSRRSFRRPVDSSRPCSRKKEDLAPAVPGTPGRTWRGRMWRGSKAD